MSRWFGRAALAALCIATAAQAQTEAPPRPTVYLGSARQLRLTPPRVERGPLIDGRLDDPVWRQAAVLDSFTQGRPIEDKPDTLGTQCLVLYDARHLYVGFRCADDPVRIQSPVVTRDNVWQGDYVCVGLDTWYEHQRSQFFCTNASGVQMDGVDVDGVDSDLAPDFLYASKGRRTEHGWEVEMAIPFTSLRFPAREELTFGVNVTRQIKRQDAEVFWAPVTKNINSYHSQMGAFEGLSGVRPGRNLQLNPSFTNAREGIRESGRFRYDDDPRFGLGLKYGITSGITADVAVTPDFSQVEADAGVIDVNQRFAIFFPEKRPFFLEGSELFSLPINLVYTRRIADPRYGVKLTGKLGKTAIGVLNAADRSSRLPVPTLPPQANPYLGRDAQFGIVRLKQDVLKNSFVGIMGGFEELLDSYNHVAGADAKFNLDDQHSLAVQGAWSDTRDRDLGGPAERTLSAAELATVDPEVLGHRGRMFQGSAAGFELRRDSKHLEASVSLLDVSRDFTANMGFLERTDVITSEASIAPKILGDGNTWFTSITPELEYVRTHDHGSDRHFGRLTDESIRPLVQVNFPLGSWAGVAYERVFTRFEGSAFPDQHRWNVWAGSNRFEMLRGEVATWGGDHVVFEEVVPGTFFRLQSWAELRFGPRLDGVFDLATEIDRRADGTRYADVTIPRLRLTYQFTTELALRQIIEWRSERRFAAGGATDSHTRSLSLDWLASYYVRPGTVVYLGYGSLLEGPSAESMKPERNNVFVKVSYLWQG